MTGEEFLEKIHSAKWIEQIKWDVEGSAWDADTVWVSITTDKETFPVLLGHPKTTIDVGVQQKSALAILVNKIMEQEGIDKRFNIHMDSTEIVDMVNYAIHILNERNR